MKDPVRPTTIGSEGVVYERATIGEYAPTQRFSLTFCFERCYDNHHNNDTSNNK